jgi:hypothetical protein
MPDYLSPRVYVEVPSAVKPIAGVGTSTAGFIGIIKENQVPLPEPNLEYDPVRIDFEKKQKQQNDDRGTQQGQSSSFNETSRADQTPTRAAAEAWGRAHARAPDTAAEIP